VVKETTRSTFLAIKIQSVVNRLRLPGCEQLPRAQRRRSVGRAGLVVATPQRGFRVRELSVEDIVGLTESRVQIESVVLRLAIERGDVRWETEIVAAHHLLCAHP
jgi:hypothetical protein